MTRNLQVICELLEQRISDFLIASSSEIALLHVHLRLTEDAHYMKGIFVFVMESSFLTK